MDQQNQLQEQAQSQPQKLTKKQEVFVSEVVKTGEPTKAALKAFDTESPEVARVIAHEYLQKPTIIRAIDSKRKTLKQALIDRGIDEDKIARKVDVLLEAIDEEGKPDYVAIDKGLKHATVLHGVFDPGDVPQGNRNTYNFIFSGEVQGKVREIEGHIKDLLTKKPNVQQNP